MRLMKVSGIVLAVLLFSVGSATAAGFRLPEAGAKAMGMGFAFTAQADDPSAIYFNPAGLTQLKGRNIMLGLTFVRENGNEFTGTTPVDNTTATKNETQKNLNFYIPNAYFTKTDSSTGFAYGIGVFAPFGLGQEYDNRNTSIFRNQITKIDLQTIVINPTVAFRVGEILSVGLGIDYMYGKAKLAKTPWLSSVSAFNNGNLYNLDLEGDGDAWGYNAGLLLKASEHLRIGASYRSGFNLKIKDGDVTISGLNPAYGTGLLGTAPSNTKASTTISMPATFALGAAYTVGPVTVEADADWTFWSSYKSLPVTIQNQVPTLFTTDAQKHWKDVVALRFGGEYRVTDPLALRAGFVYDPTPVPADTLGPELPDADRLNYMVGAGYKFASWTIDGAFMYIDKKDRTVNNQVTSAGTGFNGTWTGDAWLAGLDIGYRF